MAGVVEHDADGHEQAERQRAAQYFLYEAGVERIQKVVQDQVYEPQKDDDNRPDKER